MPAVHFYCILCGTALQSPSDSRHDLTQCTGCSRYVPVPRPANGPGNHTQYPPVFPPDVLELSVKFQCTACGSALRTDARCEGRSVACPHCHAKIRIPRWSSVLNWPRPLKPGEPPRQRAPRPAAELKAPVLSVEEIDYLSGAESRKPEAAA